MRSTAFSVCVLLGAATAIAGAEDPASASSPEALREELRQLRQEYEQRIQQLENRISELEARPRTVTNVIVERAPAEAQRAIAITEADQAIDREFKPDTVAQERSAYFTDDSPLGNRINRVLEGFLDTSGSYFRGGYGVNDKGGVQRPFQAPGALSKYRLGNETEQYGELVLARSFYKPKVFTTEPAREPGAADESLFEGPIAHFQSRISVFSDYEAGTFTFQLPELWAAIGNVIPQNSSTKFWAGPRFYRRYQSHINDFWFLNMSGLGGGVEDIQTPLGKVALAYLGNTSAEGTYASFYPSDPTTPSGLAKHSLDLRLYDVMWNDTQKGEFVFTYGWSEGATDPRTNLVQASVSGANGPAFMYLHTSEDFLVKDGFNQFSLQFGAGPGYTFTSGFEKIQWTDGNSYVLPIEPDTWRFRATEHFTVQPSEHFAVQPAFVYQYTDYRNLGGQQQWISGGVRPIWFFNDWFSIALEGGVDWVDWTTPTQGGLRGYLTKVTLAPQVSVGNHFFSRPTIRAYVTYATWSPEFEGFVGGSDYMDDTEGWSFGVQMETWW